MTMETVLTNVHNVGMGHGTATPEYLEKIDRLRDGRCHLIGELAHITVWKVDGDTSAYAVTVFSPWASEAMGMPVPYSCQCKWFRERGDTWRPCSHGAAAMLEHAEHFGIDFGQGLRDQIRKDRTS